MAGVAQLVRAPGCDSGGRGFDPRRLPHLPLSLVLEPLQIKAFCDFKR